MDGIPDPLDEGYSPPESPRGELIDDEVGADRSGRLFVSAQDKEDDEVSLVATDAGIDGGAASAEEAAMHVVDEDD